MANGAALIRESLWRDKDFRALTRTSQCLYLQLLSQRELDCAGVLVLHVDLLAKGCGEMTVDNVDHDLKALAQGRFIVIDYETDEILIRSYMRLVSVHSPKVWIAAKTAAKRVYSPEIKLAIACELRRLGRSDANDLANSLIPLANSTDTPSIPYPSGIDTQYPIDTVSIPRVPVTVPVPKLPTPDGWVGEPPQKILCTKHPDGTDEPCNACRKAREQNDANEATRVAANRQQREAFWADVRSSACCDDTGWTEDETGDVIRCPNHDFKTRPANAEEDH